MKSNSLIFSVLAAHLAMVGFNSLYRSRNFGNDSMNYVNVAREIQAGRGISQPSLGFNQARFAIGDPIPSPLTTQPPVYPLLIAALGKTWLSLPEAALLIPVVSYGIALLLAFSIARTAAGTGSALLMLGLLAHYPPLSYTAAVPLSEATGLVFLLMSMRLLLFAASVPGTS